MKLIHRSFVSSLVLQDERLGGGIDNMESALRGRIALPLLLFLRFEFRLGAFAALGDEVVAGLAAEQGNRLVFG